jgi:hypothetical protein
MEVSGQFHAPTAFTPRERAPLFILQEAELVPEPVWTWWWGENFPAPPGTQAPDYLACSPALYWLSYGKGKVKSSLCLTKHHAMKTDWGSVGIAPYILTPALDGGEWSASRRGRFYLQGKSP